jgi:periplasmic divalent cation tolerance protein
MGGAVVADGLQVRVVLVTVPDVETGIGLARAVIDSSLAACGNVIPGLTSVYRWKGRVAEDTEAMVLFKTSAALVPALEKKVLELHPYEVPEFLAMPVAAGHLPYLEWVARETINPDQE